MSRSIIFCLSGVLIETFVPSGTPHLEAALEADSAWRRRVAQSLEIELGLGGYEPDLEDIQIDKGILTHERIPYPADLLGENIGPRERAFVEKVVALAALIEAASVDDDVVAILMEGQLHS